MLKQRIFIYELIRQNILKHLRSAIGRTIHTLQYPVDYFLLIGTTNICNARCIFCRYRKADDAGLFQKGVMDFALFRRIVDAWKSDGGEPMVGLSTLAGEPLADPGVCEKVAYASSIGLKTSMVTNGILLNKNNTFARLLNAGLTNIHMSTCLPGRKLYEKVFGVDKYERALSGIYNYLIENRRIGEPCTVDIAIRSPIDLAQIMRSDDFSRFIKPFLSKRVRVNALVAYDNWSGGVEQSDLLGVMRLRSIPTIPKVPCHSMRCILIRWDGLSRACGCRYKTHDVDEMMLGQFPDKSLRQMATGPEWRMMWNGFRRGLIPDVCKACTFYNPIHRKHKII